MSKNFRKTRNNNKSIVKSIVQEGPSLFASKINVASFIPTHISNPRVTRIVRIYSLLTQANPVAAISYGSLGSQDALDYSVAAFRYQLMRVKQVKVWLEIPNDLSVSVAPPSLILTETVSGYKISDRGIAGSRHAKAGLHFSWQVQEAIIATNSSNGIFNVSTDITIPSSTNIAITIDTVCEFL